jgi:predicted transcriptional regulator
MSPERWKNYQGIFGLVCDALTHILGAVLTKMSCVLMRGGYMKRHPESLKLNIVYGLANGYTQREIGNSLGVHQSTISRHARRPDVAEMIRVEEEKVAQTWKEQIHRAAQDPEVLAKSEEICRQLLMKGLARVARSYR